MAQGGPEHGFEVGAVHRGLFTAMPSHLIPDGFSPFTRNVDFSRAIGAASKRKGTALESTGPVDAFTYVTGLHQFIANSGTITIWASAGNNIYDASVSGAWVSRYAGAMAGANVNFATFNNLTIAVSETEATQKSSGAAYSALLGSPPSNAKFVKVYKNRLVFLNSAAGKSRLTWSAPGDPENYAAASGGGFQDLDVSDGDEGTGLEVIGGIVLAFKRRSVWMMAGVGPPNDTFAFRKIAAAHGCISGRSIVNMGHMVVYLSDDRVYGISEAGVWADLSPNIWPDIEAITATAKASAAGGRLKNNYELSYDSDADGKNDSSYVLDVPNGIWSGPWTVRKARVFHTYLDGSMISGASDIKNLRRHDSGESDEGSAIDWRWRTRSVDAGDMTGLKTGEEGWFEAVPISGKTMTMLTKVDGVQVDSQAVSMTATQIGGTDRELATRFINLPATAQGRLIQFEFQNAEATAPIRLYRWGLRYSMFEDQRVNT